MQMNDMVIVSTKDHIREPPDLFDNQLSGELLASAPKLTKDESGRTCWTYQGVRTRSVVFNGQCDLRFEEHEAATLSRGPSHHGYHDVHTRIDDMDANGIAASMCFGDAIGFDAQPFHKAPNKPLALRHLQAYNDWHHDEWCMAYPARFIPRSILPTWDATATVEEVRRCAKKGYKVAGIGGIPTGQGLPPIDNEYWVPIFRALADADMTIALHFGSRCASADGPMSYGAMNAPLTPCHSAAPFRAAQGVAEWLHLEALQHYPDMRIAVSNGSIGWVPYLMERADFLHWRHGRSMHSRSEDVQPSEMMKRHFLHGFAWDIFGLRNIDEIGPGNVSYEVDYPSGDSLWPFTAELLWAQVRALPEETIDWITHRNALRWLNHDALFGNFRRQDINVGALHAKAAAKGIAIVPQSSDGGTKTFEARPVMPGDVMAMFKGLQSGMRARE